MPEEINNDDLIRVQLDMLEEMRAQRAALGNLASTNREIAKAQGINIKNSREFDDSVSGMARAARSTNPLYEAQAKALDIAIKVQDNYTAAQNSSTQAVKSFAKSLLDTEKNFAKYGGVLDSAGDAALSLGKNFGIAGLALGGLIKGVTMVAKASFEQTDRILKASDELGKMGTAGSFTSKELLSMGWKMGLTSKNLELLTKPIKDLGPNLLALSGNVGDGVKNFADLTSVTDAQREAFQRMGVSQEELIKSQSDFLALQAINGRNLKSEMKDREALKRASLDYTQNLLVLADISGQDVESIKSKQKDAAKELDWQISQTKLENQIARAKEEGRTEDLKRLQAEKEARTKLVNATVALGDKTSTRGIQQFLSTGTTSGEDAQKLARLGLTEDLVKMRDAVANGADAEKEAAKFQERYNQALLRNIDTVGTSAAINKDVADAYGYSSESLQKANRQRDVNLQGELEESRKRKEEAKKSGKDPAQDSRAALTTVEIKAQQALDKLIDKVNPLTNGFTSLTVAAGVAATALLAMAGAQGFGKLKELISNLPGAGKGGLAGQLAGGIGGVPPIAPTVPVAKPASSALSVAEQAKYERLRKEGVPAAEAKRQAGGFKSLSVAEKKITGKSGLPTGNISTVASTVSTAKPSGGGLPGAAGDHLKALGDMGSGGTLKGLAEGLGAFANPKILLGATIFGSSVGIIITTVGAGLAAATWLMGKALPTLVEGIKSFQDLDGEKLKSAGAGIFELGKGLAIFGVGSSAAGIGNLMDNIGSLFGGKTPIDKLVDFSKLDIDAPKVKNNAEALAAFGEAMAKAGLGSASTGIGNLVGNISDGIGKLVGGKSIIDTLADFSIVEINKNAVRNNADALASYGEALSKFGGGASATSGIGNLVSNLSDGIGNLVGGKSIVQKLIDFSSADVNLSKVKNNSEALVAYGKAMASLSGSAEATSGIGNLVGNLSNGVNSLVGGKSIVQKLVDFSSVDIDTNKVKNNAEALVAYGKAMASLSGSAEATVGMGNLVGNIADGINSLIGGKSLTDKLADFSIVEINANAVRNNAQAFTAYGEAMSKFSGGAAATTGIGNLVGNISDAIGKLFGGSTVMDKFTDFSKMKLGDNVKTNAEAFKAYAEAMSAFSGAGAASSAMGNAVASGLDKLFGTNILDKFKSFSKLDIDPKKTKESAEAFKIWAEGVGALSGGGGAPAGGAKPAATAPATTPTTAPATTPTTAPATTPTTAPATTPTTSTAGLDASGRANAATDPRVVKASPVAAPKTTNYTINGRTVTKEQHDKFILENPQMASAAAAVQLTPAPAGSPGNISTGGGSSGVKPVNATPSLGGPSSKPTPAVPAVPSMGAGSSGGGASIPSGGGSSTPPSPGPLTIAKPTQAKTTTDMAGNAGKLAEELGKYGIDNPIAKKAIIQTAAKESGLNPAAKESGAIPYLKTLASRGIDYIWGVFPQLKPGGRVAKEKGYAKTGVPAAALEAEWGKGDENFFDYVYGGLSTNKGPGDGYKYRGRGLVQITGRSVYDQVGKEVGKDFVKDPDLVSNNFEDASAALAGYLFMTRGGKEKTLKDLNGMKDPNEALKYVLNTVAGLGHKASDFDVMGSNLNDQLKKASQYDDLGSKAVSARDGGLVDGPSSGYPATLHGREIISPLKPDSILEMLAQTTAKTAEPTNSNSQGEAAMIDLRDMQAVFYEKMMEKFDSMIDKLSDGNDIQNDLLRYTKA